MKRLVCVVVFSLIYISGFSQLDFFTRGQSKAKMKDYKGAIIEYDKALELHPDSAQIFLYRGNAQYNLNEFVGALLDYNKAIRLNSKYAEAYINRGNTEINFS